MSYIYDVLDSLVDIYSRDTTSNNWVFYNGEYSRGAEVTEKEDEIVVEYDLPGFKKDEVEIVVDKKSLSIKAEKSGRKASKVFLLSSEVKGGTATLEDGVLVVALKRKDSARKLAIKVE